MSERAPRFPAMPASKTTDRANDARNAAIRCQVPRSAADPMKEFLLERKLVVPAGIHGVFRFFADPRNLGEITPPWLHFRIVACSTPAIGQGTVIDYKLRVRGVPLRWRSVIRDWEPPFRFVDEQLIGPYRRWVHQHDFTDLAGQTGVEDLVRYSVFGGSLVERFLVRPDVERIFEYRAQRLKALLVA